MEHLLVTKDLIQDQKDQEVFVPEINQTLHFKVSKETHAKCISADLSLSEYNVLSQQTGTVILSEEHRELGADERVRVISRTVIH